MQVIVQIVRHPNTYYRYTILHSKGLYLHINCNKMFEYEPLLNRRWIETSFRVQRSLTNVFLYYMNWCVSMISLHGLLAMVKVHFGEVITEPKPRAKSNKASGSKWVFHRITVLTNKDWKRSEIYILDLLLNWRFPISDMGKEKVQFGTFWQFCYLIVERREKGKNFPIPFRACLTVSYF